MCIRDVTVLSASCYRDSKTVSKLLWSHKNMKQGLLGKSLDFLNIHTFLIYRKRSLNLCFGPLCFGTVSVRRTKTESTIWLNNFFIFAAHFKVFSVPQNGSVHSECSELVYCMCCDVSACLGTQRPLVMLYFHICIIPNILMGR